MKENAKLSVIIPVYNVEIYLKKCVLSVLHQTYSNIEILLIDDGSKDRSGAICDEMALYDDRIIVYHKNNEGLSIARNFGLTKAVGDYIFFLDSDDFLCDDEVIVKVMNECCKKKVDFVIFNYKQYYQKDKKIIPNSLYTQTAIHSKSKIEKLESLSEQGIFPMAAWTKIIKRDFLLTNNINFIPSITAEDIPWFVDLLSFSNNFILLNIFVVTYRKQVPGAISNSFSVRKMKNLMFVIETCLEKTKYLDSCLSNFVYSFMMYEYAILIAMYANISVTEEKKQVKKWLSKYKWLLRNSSNKKTLATKYCLRFLGLEITSRLLDLYIKKNVNRK